MNKLSIFKSSMMLGVLALSACNDNKTQSSGALFEGLPDKTVVAEYNGGKITAGELKEFVSPQIKKMNEELIQAYQNAAEQSVLQKLLTEEAKKQGLSSPNELLARQDQLATVSDQEITQFMKDNKLDKPIQDPRTGQKRKVSKEEVSMYLREQKAQTVRQDFLQGILRTAGVKVLLEEPRVQLSVPADAFFKGGKDAKVVIQEFSDFECPFCAKGKNVVTEIANHYGDKVKIVFRHFPLNFHPKARGASHASICAGKQGKFWEFHDIAFDNQSALGDEMYPKWAKEIGVSDMAAFEACLKDAAQGQAIDKDMQDAEKIGVNSTPTFFVNGKKIAGALPFDRFKTIIDAELAR